MNKLFESIFFILLISCEVSVIFGANTPIVSTKLGQIKGVVRTLDDGKTSVNLFDGIRYAKAPVGALRFRSPIAETNWTGVYDATKIKKSCPQTPGLVPDDAPISEDCLFLSVWQPSHPLANGKKRAVMVFIHGGGYEAGTEFSMVYDARWIASLGDVVVVTINYRLGVFGFLNAGNEDVPGNAGLYDQIMALKWVKDNINSFGGDPHTVTIFGESAGSMSVGALIVSPLAKGLFRRGIMESGSPDSFIGSDSKERQLNKFHNFAQKLDCKQNTVNQIIACLRNTSVQKLLEVGDKGLINGDVMNPTYGDQLLPIRPHEALRLGKYDPNIDLLYGNNRDEGFLFVSRFFSDLLPERHPNITVSKAKQYISLIYMILKKSYGKQISEFYTKQLKDNQTMELLRSVSDSLGDYVLTCPTVLFGQLFAKTHKTNRAYAYRLTHKPAVPAFPQCKQWNGVCHADDLVFIYGFPIAIRGIAFTESDYKLSKDMINVWTTFAKTGTPAPIDGIQWPEAIDTNSSNSSIKYMELNPNNYRIVENGYYKTNCDDFWRQHLSTE